MLVHIYMSTILDINKYFKYYATRFCVIIKSNLIVGFFYKIDLYKLSALSCGFNSKYSWLMYRILCISVQLHLERKGTCVLFD